MKKKQHILFFFLAFVALFVGGFDHVYGHVDEDLFDLEFCPMCTAYKTLTIVFSLLVFLLSLRIYSIVGIISSNVIVFSSRILDPSFSPRSPPRSASFPLSG